MRPFRVANRMAACAALTVLAVAPSIAPLPALAEIPAPAQSNPVNCSIMGFASGYGTRQARTGSTRGPIAPQGMIAGAPPPPPPPPPQPPPSVAQEQAVRGAPTTNTPPALFAPTPIAPSPQQNERYAGEEVASIQSVASTPVSTFSVDVDTGSYANVRRILNAGQTPPAAAVRSEEMVNYFRYDYPTPDTRSAPFSITTDVAQTPWNPDSRLIRIGLKGYDVSRSGRPPANLVFLVDVSGSMASQDKLGLVKSTLTLLSDQLRPDDRVSIVVYSGTVGVLLAPTSNKEYIRQAVGCLAAAGSTAGGAALELAYSTARANYMDSGINRIILATDGDFNVGVSDPKAITEMVAKQRASGVTLTTLGFGTGNYREDLMESIADAGNGNYAYIDSAMEAQKVLDDELSATLFTIAGDVKIQVEFNPAAVREYRLIGYENRVLAEEDFANDRVDAGDIGAGHQVTALYEVIPAGGKGWLSDRRYEGNQPAPARANPSTGEAAFVKLRYKLPGENQSRLIERALPGAALAGAGQPRGDMAFAVAVAAFGQKLRGDKYLGSFGFADIRALAGAQNDFWRQEFLKLTQLAETRAGD